MPFTVDRSRSIISAMIVGRKVTAIDVTWLRREVFADGMITKEAAEELFAVERADIEKGPEWDRLLRRGDRRLRALAEPPDRRAQRGASRVAAGSGRRLHDGRGAGRRRQRARRGASRAALVPRGGARPAPIASGRASKRSLRRPPPRRRSAPEPRRGSPGSGRAALEMPRGLGLEGAIGRESRRRQRRKPRWASFIRTWTASAASTTSCRRSTASPSTRSAARLSTPRSRFSPALGPRRLLGASSPTPTPLCSAVASACPCSISASAAPARGISTSRATSRSSTRPRRSSFR